MKISNWIGYFCQHFKVASIIKSRLYKLSISYEGERERDRERERELSIFQQTVFSEPLANDMGNKARFI